MADDLDKAIRQIAQMFGATQGASGSGDEFSESTGSEQSSSPVAQTFNASAMRDNLGILSKAREMIESLNQVSDSRINLLNSIQPFLSPARQSSCASCIQLLKIVAIINAIAPGNQPGTRGE
ncbi:hypothetical protein [Thermoclostridium caenicola]|uniref:Uncharacterized protein n=1 Tax=Thermoclostridium caenicola TaxID=659425 RepID=A0A1M6BIY3_9FIRM|nr:hypothetical protein [Thermoclostridium caenicola]SHI48636.1 hypothetical protein SAMN05444373_100323 [Thermoclostridium caenicola]